MDTLLEHLLNELATTARENRERIEALEKSAQKNDSRIGMLLWIIGLGIPAIMGLNIYLVTRIIELSSRLH